MRKLLLTSVLLWAAPAAAQTVSGPIPFNGLTGGFNTAPPTISNGTFGLVQIDALGNLKTVGGATVAGTGTAGYPPGSTPFVQNFDGANTTSTAVTVTPPAGQYAYICWFEVAGLGATAATSVEFHFATLTGPGGQLFYQYTYPAGAAAVSVPVTRTFNPCIRSLNTATATGFTLPGAAGNTTTYAQFGGYFQ